MSRSASGRARAGLGRLATAFREEAARRGAKLTEQAFGRGETDFSKHLTEIKRTRPDFVFAPVYYTVMPTIARQARANGISMKSIFGGDGWHSSDLLDQAGPQLEGATMADTLTDDDVNIIRLSAKLRRPACA